MKRTITIYKNTPFHKAIKEAQQAKSTFFFNGSQWKVIEEKETSGGIRVTLELAN